jgi:nicotinate phosphoribosyltransferase
MKFFEKDSIDKIRKGYYSAVYFNRTKEILLREKNLKVVTMQVFQKNEGSVLCGVEEVKELLKEGTGYWDFGNRQPVTGNREPESNTWVSKFDELKIESLNDGDMLKAGERVMHITGPYAYFAQLESIYLGILARRTWVATNTRQCVEAAGGKPFGKTQGKPVFFFGDRFDYFQNQEGDGYAAHLGGAFGVCTEAQTAWWGGKPIGTIPHALIAVNNGDTVIAAKQFIKAYPDVNLILLVDFDNDCVRTALNAARILKDKLWGVRLDTSRDLVDISLQAKNEKYQSQIKNFEHRTIPKYHLYGVNRLLVKKVRKALDNEGFSKIKIAVSGGFYPGKIKLFEDDKTPVDVYGIGSGIVHGSNDFTADIVLLEGKPIGKKGRIYRKLEVRS